MSDRLFFALAILMVLAVVSLGLQWPQGLGARAWGPFGDETFAARLERTKPPPPPVLPASAATAQLKGGL